MITRTNGSKWGIKDSGVDFTPEIHSIIDNATTFIVVCGYNFSPYNHRTSIIPRLIAQKNAGVDVLFIAPPTMWGFGNTRHTGNIQHLVNNNIGVVLNSNNHSKWLLSDYGYYYGSLNFTASSMTTKVEIVSFCDTLHRARRPIPQWMTDTKSELLNFAISELRNFNTVVATMNLGTVNANTLRILRRTLTRILRYNPSIEKIETTLENYEDVRLELSSIIDNYFPLTSFDKLNEYWRQINNSISTLDRLAFAGNDILLRNENQTLRGLNLVGYNKLHDNFTSRINDLTTFTQENKFEEVRQEKLISLTTQTENILNNYKSSDEQN
jgi:hypothetical protein